MRVIAVLAVATCACVMYMSMYMCDVRLCVRLRCDVYEYVRA